jgi:CspA family cold shock protein
LVLAQTGHPSASRLATQNPIHPQTRGRACARRPACEGLSIHTATLPGRCATPSRLHPPFSLHIRTLLNRTGESWGIANTQHPTRNDDMTTETGTVKWFNDGKGFGFIARDTGGTDLFAHFKEIVGDGFKSLAENQRVEFEVVEGRKGLQAARIKAI